MNDDARAALGLALRHGLPYTGLRGTAPDRRLAHYLPADVARRERVVPLVLVGDALKVASPRPDPDLADAARRFPGLAFDVVLAPGDEVDARVERMSPAGEPARESDAFWRRIARHAGLRLVALEEPNAVNPLAAQLLGAERSRRSSMLAIAYDGGVLTVAASADFDEVGREAAQATGRRVEVVVAPPPAIERELDATFGPAPAAPAPEPEPEPAPEPPARVPPRSAGRVISPGEALALAVAAAAVLLGFLLAPSGTAIALAVLAIALGLAVLLRR